MEPSAILKADRYLIESWKLGYLDLKEAERRALIAGLLKERYVSTPFYRLNAEADPDYWSKFAGRVGNGFAGASYRGHVIPWAEEEPTRRIDPVLARNQ